MELRKTAQVNDSLTIAQGQKRGSMIGRSAAFRDSRCDNWRGQQAYDNKEFAAIRRIREIRVLRSRWIAFFPSFGSTDYTDYTDFFLGADQGCHAAGR